MLDTIEIQKELFFELLGSYSELCQAEYVRDTTYNDSHPTAIISNKIIEFLKDKNELNNFFIYEQKRDNCEKILPKN